MFFRNTDKILLRLFVIENYVCFSINYSYVKHLDVQKLFFYNLLMLLIKLFDFSATCGVSVGYTRRDVVD